jgi:hypothetical protein
MELSGKVDRTEPAKTAEDPFARKPRRESWDEAKKALFGFIISND